MFHCRRDLQLDRASGPQLGCELAPQLGCEFA